MMVPHKFSIVKLILFLFVIGFLSAQEAKTSIMDWSSWSNFREHIVEKIIKEQTDDFIKEDSKDGKIMKLNSHLMTGNDSGKVFPQTIEILTNKELVALNQARRTFKEESVEVWGKLPGNEEIKGMAIMNRGGKGATFGLKPALVHHKESTKNSDLWSHQSLGKIRKIRKYEIPKHGIVILKIEE